LLTTVDDHEASMVSSSRCRKAGRGRPGPDLHRYVRKYRIDAIEEP
jgi:hypothetical protein